MKKDHYEVIWAIGVLVLGPLALFSGQVRLFCGILFVLTFTHPSFWEHKLEDSEDDNGRLRLPPG
jgi:hypothetical protein